MHLDGVGDVILRPLVPADKERVAEAYRKLSAESKLNRFWSQTPELSPRMLERLTDTDGKDHVAWVVRLDQPEFEFLGAASYWRMNEDPEAAEIGITIGDDWQGRGVGTLLMSMLWWQAWGNGIRRLIGYARFENERVVQWWRSLGGTIRTTSLQREMTLELSDPLTLPAEMDCDRGRLECITRDIAASVVS